MKIKASPELLLGLLDNPAISIFLAEDGKLILASKGFFELFGRAEEDIERGLSFLDLVHPDYRERVSRFFAEEGRIVFDFLGVGGEKKTFWCEVIGSSIEIGGKRYFSGVVLDISKRKEIENRLRRELSVDRKLSELFGKLVIPFVSFEELGFSILDAILEVTGASCGLITLLGASSRTFFRIRDGACNFEVGKGFVHPVLHEGGRPVVLDLSQISPPEGHVPLKNAAFIPVAVEGRTLGHILICNKHDGFSEYDLDVGMRFSSLFAFSIVRDEMLSSLRESEERYKVMTEFSLAGMFVETESGMVFVNPSFLRIFGVSSSEVLGKSFSEFVEPECRAIFDEHKRKILSGSYGFSEFSCKALSKKGDVWISVLLSKVRFMGKDSIVGNVIDITDRKELEFKLRDSLDELNRVLEGTIKAFSSATEKRDPYTAGHQKRVAQLSREIAFELQLPPDQVRGIFMAALVHDIGKIAVPSEILTKPGKLTDVEFSILKTHPVVGYEILKDVDFPWPIADMVLQHHERLDGSGYPYGLKNGEILLGARIIGVADVVEAMASHRPYRPALGVDAALEEIKKGKGKLYDPDVVDSCIRLFDEKGFQFD